MALSIPLVASLLCSLAAAQMPGINPDTHPKLNTWKCTLAGGCVQQTSAVVFDSLSHWIHQANNTALGCGGWGAAPNKTVCPDAATCQKNCVMEGITDYSAFGVNTTSDTLSLRYLNADGNPIAQKLYLLASGEKQYEMIKLAGNEFSFDVDVSKLACGMNGALYLTEMAANGGASTLNTGGAAYGTGYCDAQCSVTPFVNGVGNIQAQGACCSQVDLWKANSRATIMAPYSCSKSGPYLCSGTECGATGVCDKNGCGMNPYLLGKKNFYGRGTGFQIDTTKPFTVVTQFPLDGGQVKEIHRLYIQNGELIDNAVVNVTGYTENNFLDDDFCTKSGASRYIALGGNKQVGSALSRGMAVVFGLWWDDAGSMNWLDSGNAGPCSATEGAPANIKKVQPDTSVKFSAIKWGEIGSTL